MAEVLVVLDSPPHTCWEDPLWDGALTDGCAGCEAAMRHPCEWCGYGQVFTTHNPLAHADNGDTSVYGGEDTFPEEAVDKPIVRRRLRDASGSFE